MRFFVVAVTSSILASCGSSHEPAKSAVNCTKVGANTGVAGAETGGKAGGRGGETVRKAVGGLVGGGAAGGKRQGRGGKEETEPTAPQRAGSNDAQRERSLRGVRVAFEPRDPCVARIAGDARRRWSAYGGCKSGRRRDTAHVASLRGPDRADDDRTGDASRVGCAVPGERRRRQVRLSAPNDGGISTRVSARRRDGKRSLARRRTAVAIQRRQPRL